MVLGENGGEEGVGRSGGWGNCGRRGCVREILFSIKRKQKIKCIFKTQNKIL